MQLKFEKRHIVVKTQIPQQQKIETRPCNFKFYFTQEIIMNINSTWLSFTKLSSVQINKLYTF